MRIKNGYSLVELIIAIALVAILIIPIALMFKDQVTATIYSGNINQAISLARLEMARINNLSYNDTTLADGYDNTTSDYDGYNFDLRRVVGYLAGTSDNLKEVAVTVSEGNSGAALLNLVTYKADVGYGFGSGGGTPASGGQADSFAASAGSISGTDLENVTLQNTGGGDIVLTQLIVIFTGTTGIKFKTFEISATEYWAGTENSGSAVTLGTNFTLTAGTTYTNAALFTFSKNLSSADIIFVFEDDTESDIYSRP